MHLPKKKQWNGQQNQLNNAGVWLGYLFSAAILWVNYANLQYNRLQVYQSGRVANQLQRLNQSNLIIEINNKLREEKINEKL